MTTHPYELKEVLARAENISLSFGEKVILKPTTIEVRDIYRPGMSQGQVVGILGPSGIGKTQFSRVLAGLQEPTTGQFLVSDPADPTGTKLTVTQPGIIGMVAQNYPLFNHRTVIGNLLVALEQSPLDKKAREAKAQEHLKLFALEDKADLYPAQLSGGQRQRVAIIQALLSSEHFVVMDEPFTGLDPIMKDVLCEAINKIATLHEKNTIFVVAHDIGALVSISDCLWLFGRDPGVPGATIKMQYNLIDHGLAWQPDIERTPQYHAFIDEIKAQFQKL